MKKYALLLGIVLSLSLSAVALALTLDAAKASGQVGEKVDGFLSAVTTTPSAEVEALIASTNEGRRQVYVDLAKRNNITVEAVGILAAEKLRNSAAKGEFIQSKSGQWERKP